MIRGVHAMFYSSKPADLRVFLREKLGFVTTDIGDGWLIFNFSEGEIGVHPEDQGGQKGAPTGVHDISFYCDDIQQTVSELKEKGVEFKGEIEDHGYGLVTYFKVPGDFYLQLYEPKYQK